jgi:hypothetical protein
VRQARGGLRASREDRWPTSRSELEAPHWTPLDFSVTCANICCARWGGDMIGYTCPLTALDDPRSVIGP